jgi:xanthine dehydrogenase iron-sulfur cluster and FAD-binding subunit A
MTDELIGQRFNKLIVLNKVESYRWVNPKTKKATVKARYNCLCDCGREVIVRANSLKKGTIKQCQGCSYAARKQSTRRLTALERLFRIRIKRNAEHRGIPIEITAEDFLQKKGLSKSCQHTVKPFSPQDHL